MELFMYAHGGSGNHGCEAIARGTALIFQEHRKTLYSTHPNEDIHYGVDQFYTLLDASKVPPKKLSLEFWKAYWALKVKHDYMPLNKHNVFNTLDLAPKGSVALSIGGDNYCYGNSGKFAEYNGFLKKKGHKTVLWGCSVEPSQIDEDTHKDLALYDLITARESITYEALKKINPNTILAPDPAFMLPVSAGRYPEGLGKKPYIGINVSPMIQGYEDQPDATEKNYVTLIQHILDETDRDIALIPHVIWDYSNDQIPIRQLYERFRSSGRVFLVSDQNCMQLKDIISGCEFFVGARTHSTIAAYSTCVPTLVVGYSVKAKGIARDLFGTEEGFVLPVQSLQNESDLTNAFMPLYARREELRDHLTQIMPGYKAGIQAAKEAVEKL